MPAFRSPVLAALLLSLSGSLSFAQQAAVPAAPPSSRSFLRTAFTGGGIGILDLEVNSTMQPMTRSARRV